MLNLATTQLLTWVLTFYEKTPIFPEFEGFLPIKSRITWIVCYYLYSIFSGIGSSRVLSGFLQPGFPGKAAEPSPC